MRSSKTPLLNSHTILGGKQRSKQAGFSLVEITLALGILSLSLMVIIGLMPAGLNTMREAMDSTTETQIFRQVSGEILLTPFSELQTLADRSPRFFSSDGLEQSERGRDTYYELDVQLVDPVFPGAETEHDLNRSLRTVRVILEHGSANGAVGTKSYYNLTIPSSGN